MFSCEQFKSYIYGLQFTVAIDHKLLLKLKSPSCSELPTRIHRWSLRLQEFDFKLEHEPGINNITDILWRKPFFDTPIVNQVEPSVNYVVSNSISKTSKFFEISEATQNNQILTKVCDTIIINGGFIKTIFISNPTTFYERNSFYTLV